MHFFAKYNLSVIDVYEYNIHEIANLTILGQAPDETGLNPKVPRLSLPGSIHPFGFAFPVRLAQFGFQNLART